MTKQDKRQAVKALHEAGRGKKEIARLVSLDIKTVRHILACNSEVCAKVRKDRISLNENLLRDTYGQAEGYLQRVHEILSEEHGVEIAYSTLTKRARQMGLGQKESGRKFHVDDIPGEEMQHDTSPYRLQIGDKEIPVIGSGLYLRYSKLRYVRFYRRFNRFVMKCFLDEALRYWGYCAKTCIIDNTSLAIWYGTGPRAVFAPEMKNFAKNYGFEWQAHEVGHHNRKAGKERNFWTVETNFFPGRRFQSMENLNMQAFEWATKRFAQRPQSKTGLIPVTTFEHEKPYLIQLPEYISSPSLPHERCVDEYGFVSFQANYYWVPEYTREKVKIKTVQLIEYAKEIVIFHHSTEIARYDLPSDGLRNGRFAPPGAPLKYQPRNRKKPSIEEEKSLRGLGKTMGDYVDFVQSKESGIHYKHEYLRRLYLLAGKMSGPLLQQVLGRAIQYKVNRIDVLTRIAGCLMKQSSTTQRLPLPEMPIDPDYQQREAYKKGRFCDEPGLAQLPSLLDSSVSTPNP